MPGSAQVAATVALDSIATGTGICPGVLSDKRDRTGVPAHGEPTGRRRFPLAAVLAAVFAGGLAVGLGAGLATVAGGMGDRVGCVDRRRCRRPGERRRAARCASGTPARREGLQSARARAW